MKAKIIHFILTKVFKMELYKASRKGGYNYFYSFGPQLTGKVTISDRINRTWN